MELFNSLFTIFFFIFMLFIMFTLFTKQGRNVSRKMNLGEIIEDYGVIGQDEFHGKQQISLLRCRKNNEEYYVLEIQRSAFGAMRVDWIKLSDQTVSNLLANLH